MSKMLIKGVAAGGAGGLPALSSFVPIDPVVLDAEIREYSITPDTLKYREYDSSYDDLTFVELYEYGAQNVVRHGINLARVTAEIGVWPLLPSATVSGAGASGGGGKSRSSAGASGRYSEAEARIVKHHSAEIAVFKSAVDSLLDTMDTRVVICDILERDKGVIKDVLVSHAVVLYKNPSNPTTGKYEVVVIDPSNFQYSSHLVSDDMIKQSATAPDLIHPLLAGIKTFHKTTQIYKADGGNVGPAPAQYRDCIDVAVKLSFGLSQSPADLSFSTIDDIKDNEMVVMVSNQLDATSLPIGPARLKQTSDVRVVHHFHQLQNSIFVKLNALSLISEQADSRIKVYDSLITNARLARECAFADSVLVAKTSKSTTLAKYHAIIDDIESKTHELTSIYADAWDASCIAGLEAADTELLGNFIPRILGELDS